MSEPFWSALGAPAGSGGVDYEGAWAAGTSYLAGDVVAYNGINYLAVNPSTGVPPSGGIASDIGTVLPSTPFDGQEFTLVDSLSAPTYSWQLRYMAAKASNKWVFIGGAPRTSAVATAETTAATLSTWLDLTTLGPDFTIPVAGDWDITQVFSGQMTGDGHVSMSYAVGATAADQNWGCGAGVWNNNPVGGERTRRWAGLAAGTLIRAKYMKTYAGTMTFVNREIRAQPVAVGG